MVQCEVFLSIFVAVKFNLFINKSLIYGLLGVNRVAMGAMAMGKSLYFVTSMLLCAPLHGLKFVLSPLFFIKSL